MAVDSSQGNIDAPAGGETGACAARPRSLRGRAVRAAGFRVVGYGGAKVIQLGSNVLLAHIIGQPKAWGVLTIAQALLQGLKMFSEVGIGPAIIQSKRGADPVFLDTAWTIQACRGVAIWLAGCALAWPLSWIYGEKLLLWMLPVMALGSLLAGFQSTRIFTLNRQLAEGRRTMLELVERFMTRGSSVGFALLTPTAWAFVWGSLVGNAVLTIGTHTYLPGHRNRFRIDRQSAHELLHFGRWIFIGTVIAFFSQQADKLILGKIDDLAALGVYGMALTVSKLPQEMIGVLTSAVLFPVLSELARATPERHSQMVAKVRSAMLAPAMAAVVGVALGAPWFFRLFYPEAFHDAGWMAALSVGAVWIGVLDATSNKALLSIGATRPLAIAGFLDLCGTVLASLLGYRFFGMPGFIVGTMVGAACGYAYVQRALIRRGVWVIAQDLCWTGAVAALTIGGYLAGEWMSSQVEPGWKAATGVAWACLVVGSVGAWAAWRTLGLVRGRKS